MTNQELYNEIIERTCDLNNKIYDPSSTTFEADFKKVLDGAAFYASRRIIALSLKDAIERQLGDDYYTIINVPDELASREIVEKGSEKLRKLLEILS